VSLHKNVLATLQEVTHGVELKIFLLSDAVEVRVPRGQGERSGSPREIESGVKRALNICPKEWPSFSS
jgi:hypothetical protein